MFGGQKIPTSVKAKESVALVSFPRAANPQAVLSSAKAFGVE